jgi:hypothetical protein
MSDRPEVVLFYLVFWLFVIILAIALLAAQLRLFSIDRTLKAILEELRAAAPAESRPREKKTNGEHW